MSDLLDAQSSPALHAAVGDILALAGIKVGSGDEIDADQIEKAVAKLKQRLSSTPANRPMATGSGDAPDGTAAHQFDPTQQQILIVGELGIITYQLKVALTKLGASVSIIKGVDEAAQEFSKRPYNGVLVDIFMPTEREGLMVIREVRRQAELAKLAVNVVALSTSFKEQDKDLRVECTRAGASAFFEKVEGWHQRVVEFFAGKAETA